MSCHVICKAKKFAEEHENFQTPAKKNCRGSRNLHAICILLHFCTFCNLLAFFGIGHFLRGFAAYPRAPHISLGWAVDLLELPPSMPPEESTRRGKLSRRAVETPPPAHACCSWPPSQALISSCPACPPGSGVPDPPPGGDPLNKLGEFE